MKTLHKLRNLIYLQLTQGVAPHELALTITLGISIGIMPLIGVATFICLFLAAVFRLNQPLLQLTNYMMTPFHLILIPVFLRAGEWVCSAKPISFSLVQMMSDIQNSPLLFLQHYAMAAAYAVIAWLLIVPVVAIIVYFCLKMVFVHLHGRLK